MLGWRRRLTLLAGTATLGLLAWVAPSAAQACSCFPSVDIDWPVDGATTPANGRLLMRSFCGGDPQHFNVIVDGDEASLRLDDAMSGGTGLEAYRIEPQPQPGATVEISGCPEEGCLGFTDDTQLSFTVGAADLQAPSAPGLGPLSFELEDVELFDCGELDQEIQRARDWEVDIEASADAMGQALLYVVSLGPEGGGEPTTAQKLALDGSQDITAIVRRFEEDAGSNVCAEVRTFDMAGNEAEPVEVCRNLEQDDTLDGGQGCVCSASDGSRGWSAAGLLALLLLVRRRRG